MRTSVEISPSLLNRARRLAATRHTTLRALIEEGLRLVIESQQHDETYALPDRSFGSGGLREGLTEASWEALRDLAYEGRGT